MKKRKICVGNKKQRKHKNKKKDKANYITYINSIKVLDKAKYPLNRIFFFSLLLK